MKRPAQAACRGQYRSGRRWIRRVSSHSVMKEGPRFAMIILHLPSSGVLKPAQQAVAPVGHLLLQGRIQPAIPDVLRFPRACRPASRVEPYLSQPGFRQTDAGIFSIKPCRQGGATCSQFPASASGPYPHIGFRLSPDRRRSSSCVRSSMSLLPAPTHARTDLRQPAPIDGATSRG